MPSRRFVEQLIVIERELGVSLTTGPTGTGPGDPPCAFQRGVILVRQEDLPLIMDPADSPLRDMPRAQRDRNLRAGMARVHVGGAAAEEPRSGDPARRDDDVAAALERLEPEIRSGRVNASPNHIISIMNGTSCPADEPWPTMDLRSVRDVEPAPSGNRRPRVLVIDTGLVAGYETLGFGAHTSGALRRGETETELDEYGNPTDFIREYVGHGTFITGLLTAVAPTADVYVSNSLPHAGAAFEDEFGESLFTALAGFQREFSTEDWPDIISLSAGTPVFHRLHGLLTFARFMEELRIQPTLLVAAASNNGNSIRFWPAAFADEPQMSDAVVSVGALREDLGGRACFSDFGPWVKVFAPGERLVSAFAAVPRRLQYQHATFGQCQFLPPADNYCCTCRAPQHDGALSHQPPLKLGEGSVADFTGTHDARWSGTSFATPLVAGYVAQRMAQENRADARGVYADMRKDAERIDVAGETALKIVPSGFNVQPMVLDR